MGPSCSCALIASSPPNTAMVPSPDSVSRRPFSRCRCKPLPASTTRLRSIPGKREKAPLEATLALLMRQSKSSRLAPAGQMASSSVEPPPFFQGMAMALLGSSRV